MAKKKKDAKAQTFEERLARLEEIVEHLESGDVGLDESLKLYAEGADLIQRCRTVLGEAEQRIRKLTETAEGDLATEPFDEAEGDEAEADNDLK
ncbi:MAG: exodeoxyribonuclease VII small subunit [Planctomycetes bacterium]|nr:exodeoxyribonuclease VII small subunit [Planctomycetota bacterium]